MPMRKFTTLTSPVVPLARDDIDTDQIVPARFLKGTDRRSLGQHLFADWRSQPDGSPRPDFPLNQESARGAAILLAGHGFGCGSSREHAAWALLGAGFRAVIAGSFADIFRNNAAKNGLVPVQVPAERLSELFALVQRDPRAPFTIDLAEQVLSVAGVGPIPFPMDGFTKRNLLEGIDPLDYLLAFEDRISAYEAAHEVSREPLPRENGGA